jgi:hypothetical protein
MVIDESVRTGWQEYGAVLLIPVHPSRAGLLDSIMGT